MALLGHIHDDNDIKQGLFPSPGGNVSTAKGGGKLKIYWHWKLAILTFGSIPVYGQSIEQATKGNPKTVKALRAAWTNKIKNRLVT